MKHKVSELEGALLDAAVALAEGKSNVHGEWAPAIVNDLGRCSIARNRWDCARYFEPSKNWGHGGPIIEREKISVFPRMSNLFEPIDWAGVKHVYPEPSQDSLPDGSRFRYIEHHAQTPLIAAMRAYVASKFGDTVELP